MRTTPILTLVVGLAGCADTVSNALFAEDIEFLQALPDPDRQQVDLDEEVEEEGDAYARAAAPDTGWCDAGHFPVLLCLTYEIGTGVNWHVLGMLSYVDLVRRYPPSARTEDTRTWGPYEVEPDLWMRLDMERAGGFYLWGFSAATAEDGPWTTFFDGEHYSGETVVRGVGVYEVDYAAFSEVSGDDWTGGFSVEYSNEDDTELLVRFDDMRVEDMSGSLTADYWYWGDGERGDLEFRTEADFTATTAALEELGIRSRWEQQVGGRADATLDGGDIPESWGEVRVTQCWGRYGLLTYQGASVEDVVEDVGTEDQCLFESWADVEHI